MELSRLFSLDSDLKTSKYLCSLFGVKCQGDILFLFLFFVGMDTGQIHVLMDANFIFWSMPS